MTRVYLATTREELARLHETGTMPADTRRVAAEGDDEDSEYAALTTAATLSAGLAPADGRRVVVVAEPAVRTEPVALADVVAVHCDTDDRAPDADPDDALAWFATQEIPDLI